MSYFLWIEDFESSPKITATEVFGGLNIDDLQFADHKQELKRNLKAHGIYIELSFQDGLGFIRQNLGNIDYIILDIDLAAYSKGDVINADVLALLETFQDYKKPEDETENEQLLNRELANLKTLAGFYLYTELVVELGFPKQHILFCSNHGENTRETQKAFKSAKIASPKIYEKSAPEVQKWVKNCYENPYSRLRRGIIEGCQFAKNLPIDRLYFNEYTKGNESVQPEDIYNYLEVLENFLPLLESANKKALYKLFIRTLSHEWEAAKNIRRDENKKDTVLAWIMRNTRHWITHNSNLFGQLDEKIVAYLFIVNLRTMFNSDDDTLQGYEMILLNLFADKALSESEFKEKSIPVSDAYLALKNIVLDEKKNDTNIQDAFYFNELANNLQLSKSSRRNDTELFMKLLYQMFWLTTSNPYVDTKNRKLLEIKFGNFNYTEKPYLFELARHIYNRSFP
ncbi:hypothetical protein [Methyloglobulus sp.]|uniref:hypothetical protein n=1 Tax=Methyloglobulus sp. TaxID=2518622 RepID=UPI0032B70036